MTNTYQASITGYVKHLGLSPEESAELIKASVRLAHEAREKFLGEQPDAKRPWVVGSIGPYGAHMHNGSEYLGTYCGILDPKMIQDWHRSRIDAILEAGVDALAIETIPCQVRLYIRIYR